MWLFVYLPMVVHHTKRPLLTGATFVIAVLTGQNTYSVFSHVNTSAQEALALTLLHLTSFLFIESLHLTLRLRLVYSAIWLSVAVATMYEYLDVLALIQCVLIVAAHVNLIPDSPWNCKRVLSILFVALLVLPMTSIVLSIALQSNSSRLMVRNFAGMPLCHDNPPRVAPTSYSQLARHIREHKHVRIAGAFRSWSPLICPPPGGILIETVNLRRLDVTSLEHRSIVKCEAGVTFGTLLTVLRSYNFDLPITWYYDITIGGAIATGSHNRGQTFVECCVDSVELMLANGTVWNVTRRSILWKHISGSAGMLGAIVSADIKVVPFKPSKHTIVERKWTTRTSLDTLVEQWMRSGRADGRLQIIGKEKTLFSDTFDPSDDTMEDRRSTPQVSFNYPAYQYALNGFAFDWYASTWFLLFNMYGWIVIPFHVYAPQMAAFIRDGKTSVHESEPTSPFDKSMAKVTTEAASVEADVSIGCDNVLTCLHAFLDLNTYVPSVELRKATTQDTEMHTSNGPCVVHFDVSFPIWILPSMKAELQSIKQNCASNFPHHAGKLSINMLEEVDMNQPSPVASFSTASTDSEFVKMATITNSLIKFSPNVR